MRVLLTGGYGCIGSWIVRLLLERGDEAFIYDLKEDTHRMRRIMEDDLSRAPGAVEQAAAPTAYPAALRARLGQNATQPRLLIWRSVATSS